MRVLAIGIVLLFLGIPVYAQDRVLTVDLAQESVDITTGFGGAHLSLFGEKKDSGEVAVFIKGPISDALVRKKGRVGGIWMNNASLKFEDVPQFYDFALSDAEDEILNPETRKAAGIGFDALKFEPVDNKLEEDERNAFQQALVRNRQESKLFPADAKDIVFLSDTFFKTEFYIPSNVPMGKYIIETFLIQDEKVADRHVTNVTVGQVGFSSNVFQFANSYSLAYALIIVMLAVVAGWLSNAVRRNDK